MVRELTIRAGAFASEELLQKLTGAGFKPGELDI